MSDQPEQAEAGTDAAISELEAAASAVSAAMRRASTARMWAVVLMNDLAWLIGAASQAGIDVPTRISDSLQEAIGWVAED